jgi:saccharopine dehydrogenase-like NADP-dependent oxidoreductase
LPEQKRVIWLTVEAGQRCSTLFHVEPIGTKCGVRRRQKLEVVGRYGHTLGYTSMARTTAFTGAIVARMMARGELQAKGLLMPEQVITGPLLDTLLSELAAVNVRFEETTETVEVPRN